MRRKLSKSGAIGSLILLGSIIASLYLAYLWWNWFSIGILVAICGAIFLWYIAKDAILYCDENSKEK